MLESPHTSAALIRSRQPSLSKFIGSPFAIDLLEEKDRKDFKIFVNENNSYNQGNMFICRSKEIMNDYYITIFDWLNKCENLFGFDKKSYGTTRIYAFLAERFLPYWFNKYTKTKEWPIAFYDTTK